MDLFVSAVVPTRRSLPEKSLLAGRRGGSLIRKMSERSLVKKISTSIKLEGVEEDGVDSDLESTFNNSNSSFCFDPETHNFDIDEEDSFAGPSLSRVQYIQSTKAEQEQLLWEMAEDKTTAASVLPPFHRKELEWDSKKVLGSGAFSQVFALESIKNLNGEHNEKLSSLQVESRLKLFKKTMGKNQNSLVVKHLNRKLLRKPKEFKAAAMDLEREAKILALVRHANIVRLRGVTLGGTAALDSGHYNDYFLVMDRLCDTLDKRIQRWKETFAPGVTTIAIYAQQLASALAYLHDHRLVFRDVKAPNIGFIESNRSNNDAAHTLPDRLQLFDFGLCRSLPSRCFHASHADQETFHMSLAGTTRYMAPELMQGHSYNVKVDVYAWSLVLWEMIEQEKPYLEVKPRHFQQYITELEIRPAMDGRKWEHAPAALKDLLKKSWAADVDDRLAMADAYHKLSLIIEDLQDSSSFSTSTRSARPVEPDETKATADLVAKLPVSVC
ncbi:Probable LIM domain-containing serine/threonine-protein kinase DDB [Seminavis robusta]|uniref:Probable LIM domain-containing serine/threonine-protein kinase DDB n=1 Tax=Seminavis robusta TaxID=568900 RepID=A0A9N8HWV7_9STRA|nr:Probable LIM domain-containing serine/threonine-protein kinase DDB [Seminavis robusta]|eukprot:Sro2285_g321940.1 Probable LIM domain-containing serine/threonine-protein kinase DDB (498) ;mRNA; f:5150-6643